MKVDVSVITPTFRRPAELVEAVRSALDQRGVSVEVRVLDDSPERSAAEPIAQLADPRVTYGAFDPPTGGRPARVRNAAWPHAKGRFLHFLDDDDRVCAGGYRVLADALDANPEVGVAFGAVVPFGEDATAVEKERHFFEQGRAKARKYRNLKVAHIAHQIFNATMLVNSSCMIRRELVTEIGGYDESLISFEDVHFFTRAIARFGAVYVDQPVLERRVGPSLVHRLGDAHIVDAYRYMQGQFRQERGTATFYATKVAARLLRWV
jgi:glycosyltransferase involved in cell wall biosynthesis